jgi:hypothetical protein
MALAERKVLLAVCTPGFDASPCRRRAVSGETDWAGAEEPTTVRASCGLAEGVLRADLCVGKLSGRVITRAEAQGARV